MFGVKFSSGYCNLDFTSLITLFCSKTPLFRLSDDYINSEEQNSIGKYEIPFREISEFFSSFISVVKQLVNF